MAIYHFSAKVIGRSQGRSVVAAAAYRSASELLDEHLDCTHNYTAKADVVHSEILLPEGAPARWRMGEDATAEEQRVVRERLWNEVEATEKRRDAQLARDIEIALPRELTRAEAIALARDFVCEQFVSRGMVADLNVHWGVGADGEVQPHAHVMLTMREIVPGPGGHPEEAQFGKKVVAWNDRALLKDWRECWAEMANKRLHELGHDARIDHRSYAEQGIDLEPQHKIGPAGARREEQQNPEPQNSQEPPAQNAERRVEHRAIARRNGERIAADPLVALDAITRQHSTFTRADLARFVNRHTDGAEQFGHVLAKVEASQELVRLGEDGRGRLRFTTREMVRVERGMERDALALAGRVTHGVALERRRAVAAGAGLGAEQQIAFGHVTRARDLVAVVGYAGTGKSTMLGVARQAWEAEGYRVRGAALSGIAAEGLEGGSGIPSRTLASLEWAWGERRELLTVRDVLVVDEAGMVGSRQMARVLSAVTAAGAKVVLVGDAEQLQAIEAGAAFRAVVERHGAAEITEVRRQREEWQREATRELATGRTEAALGRYEAAGMVKGHATQAEALAALVAGWDAVRQQSPHGTQVMLAGTNADVAALNALARDRLRAAGALGAEHQVSTERGVRAMAAGDQVMFLRNERGLGADRDGRGGAAVKNGTLATVLAVEAGGGRLTVRLDRGGSAGPAGGNGSGTAPVVTFSLSDYGHLDWGYAATTHKGQGVTVDRAHVLASTFMDRHAAYVALTRHRDGVVLHWSAEMLGNRAGLGRTLGRERAKDTSLDYDAPGLEQASGSAPEPAWRAWSPAPEAADAAEQGASAYAERRGVVPAAEAAAGPGTPGQRAAARTAVLLNRVGALRQAGEAAAQAHTDQVERREAVGLGAPDLEPRFRQARAWRALDGALAAAGRAVEQGSAALERVAAAVAGLPELVREMAERARAVAQEAAAQRQVQQAAATGVAGWRERYAAEKRQRAAAVARDAQAQGLAERWSGLIVAYNKALPGLDRDPRHAAARAALDGFARELRQQPEAAEALRTRPEAFGMGERPTLARVLAAPDPARAVAAHLDGCEAAYRVERQQAAQEASRRAQEAARSRLSQGPSM